MTLKLLEEVGSWVFRFPFLVLNICLLGIADLAALSFLFFLPATLLYSEKPDYQVCLNTYVNIEHNDEALRIIPSKANGPLTLWFWVFLIMSVCVGLYLICLFICSDEVGGSVCVFHKLPNFRAPGTIKSWGSNSEKDRVLALRELMMS